MGILNKLFNTASEEKKEKNNKTLPWHPLEDEQQLPILEKESQDGAVAIFKHSTSCGISKMVLRNFEREYNEENFKGIKLYFLDLLKYRQVSNEVASHFKVQHESPQLIVIKDGTVKHHASHQDIQADDLLKFA